MLSEWYKAWTKNKTSLCRTHKISQVACCYIFKMKKMKKLIADCTADREKPIASFRRESGPPWQNVRPRSGHERESEQIMNLASFQLAIVSERGKGTFALSPTPYFCRRRVTLSISPARQKVSLCVPAVTDERGWSLPCNQT